MYIMFHFNGISKYWPTLWSRDSTVWFGWKRPSMSWSTAQIDEGYTWENRRAVEISYRYSCCLVGDCKMMHSWMRSSVATKSCKTCPFIAGVLKLHASCEHPHPSCEHPHTPTHSWNLLPGWILLFFLILRMDSWSSGSRVLDDYKPLTCSVTLQSQLQLQWKALKC